MKKLFMAILGAALLVGLLALPMASGARTVINCTTLVENGEPASMATPVTLNSTTNHTIALYPGTLLRVVESGNVTITVLAGDDPPAFRSSLGDLTVTIANATSETWIGPFESARFVNETGYLLVNTNSTDGTIEAFRFPV
ncbi:TPA_asm: hypothetical protein vir515_00023 [Caudoviricetes sp. vir515]|nr:TPA_asm: hypothetical protein vir515_00023 [Caudoviricetes sp. vir515]